VGQAAAGVPVFPTPPVAGSISSNETGPTSIRVQHPGQVGVNLWDGLPDSTSVHEWG